MKTILMVLVCLAGAGAAPGFVKLYPQRAGNLRNLKLVESFPAGAKGVCSPFRGALMPYRFGGVLRCGESGTVRFMRRGYPQHRTIHECLKLSDSRFPKQTVRVPFLKTKHFPGEWERGRLTWGGGKAEVFFGEGRGKLLTAELPKGWRPDTIALDGHEIDELELESGGGRLVVDWEGEPLTARVYGESGGAQVQLQGFDNFFVSEDEGSRDAPALILQNGGKGERRFEFEFELRSELRGIRKKWRQTGSAAGGGWSEMAVRFPFRLESDIYHIEIREAGGAMEPVRKHFLFAEKRKGEKRGTVKFGFHNGARDATLFSDPDAVPLDFRHQYWTWGYWAVVPWSMPDKGAGKDYWGEDPERPMDAWNWPANEAWMEGRQILACVSAEPHADWQRLRRWGDEALQFNAWKGGEPDYGKFREFLREAMRRWGKRVMAVEADNEPNCNQIGKHPETYAKLAELEAATVAEFDAEIPLFYISGTGPFQGFQKKVNECKPKGVAGLSLHTYCTPTEPERCGLYELIRGAQKESEAALGVKRYGNTETGVAMIGRFEPERAIPAEEVRERVRLREKNFYIAGWPGPHVDEWQAARILTKNAAVNFACGAEFFTYFGWNHGWIVDDWSNPKEKNQEWTMITGTKCGERSPTLLALAVGVQIEQMQGVLAGTGKFTHDRGAYGAAFRKANGGGMAFLSRHLEPCTVRLLADTEELERVTYLGERTVVKAEGTDAATGKKAFAVEADEDPAYYHAARGEIEIEPSPWFWLAPGKAENGKGSVNLAFKTRLGRKTKYTIEYDAGGPIVEKGLKGKCEAEPKKLGWYNAGYDLRGATNDMASFTLVRDDGARWRYRYRLTPPREYGVKETEVADARMPVEVKANGALAMDTNEQCAIGGNEKTASLADPDKWGGPEELSAKAWLGYDAKYVYVYGEVKEKKTLAPEEFPGTEGSCAELFFDMRVSGQNAGQAAYTANTYQFIVAPPGAEGGGTRLACVQSADAEKKGCVANSGKTAEGWWFSLAVPWKWHPLGKPCEFRFDAAVNGCDWRAGKAKRKTQMVMFGTKDNYRDASRFVKFRLEKGGAKGKR